MVAAILLLVGLRPGPATIERIEYRGWTNCVRLSSEAMEVVVVPQVGRIMRICKPTGPNLLWENPELDGSSAPRGADWTNYGGDKLWPAPQARWAWPPPKELDGSPYKARIEGGKVVLVSPPSRLGIQFTRLISLSGSHLTVENLMRNVSKSGVEWSIWQVAQLNRPQGIRASAKPSFEFPRGWRPYPGVNMPPNVILEGKEHFEARHHPSESYKIAANGRPFRLVGVWPSGTELSMQALFMPKGVHPDGDAPMQIFSNPEPNAYMEAELTGPIVKLKAGAVTKTTIVFTLFEK